jgi:hypothetical protein
MDSFTPLWQHDNAFIRYPAKLFLVLLNSLFIPFFMIPLVWVVTVLKPQISKLLVQQRFYHVFILCVVLGIALCISFTAQREPEFSMLLSIEMLLLYIWVIFFTVCSRDSSPEISMDAENLLFVVDGVEFTAQT